MERKQTARGIPVLVTAIGKIQLFPAQLTSVHADLCQVCKMGFIQNPSEHLTAIIDKNRERNS